MSSKMNILRTFVRNYSIRNLSVPKTWEADGQKYGKVTYYPRHRNHEDPPFTPSKVLMVKRVKPFKGNPYWEKETLIRLGMKENTWDPVIVKNTPDICAMLWSVKHLVKITPIKLPENLPKPDDLNGTYLHENGTFEIVPKVDPRRLEAVEKFENDVKRLESKRIGEKLRLQWLKGHLPS